MTTLLVPFLFSKSYHAFRPTPNSLRPSSLLLRRTMSSSTSNDEMIPGRPTWQQTMLRIKDPAASISFYEKLGFTLIDTFDFPLYKFSLYFLSK